MEHTEHKQIGTKKKVLLSHNNQNTKCTEQRKNIKSCKRRGPSNKDRPFRITPDFSTETLKAERSWTHTCLVDCKRSQMPAYTTIPSTKLNQHSWRNQDIP